MGTAMLWLALNYNQSKPEHWRWLLLNGLVLGAATAGKASQLMLGIFPAIATVQHALLDNTTHFTKKSGKILSDGAVMVVITALVLFFMFFMADISPKDFWISLQSIQRYYQHPGPPELLEHYSFSSQLLTIIHYFAGTLGWPLLICMLIGIYALWQRAEKLPLLLLTLPLIFFTAYFASVPAFFDRSFCALAASISLLAAIGIEAIICRLPAAISKPLMGLLLTALACWQPITIQYHLQRNLLRSHHDDERLAFQQQLKREVFAKTGVDFWLKNIDRSDLFSQSLPQKPEKNPRIYVAEDLNDWNSRVYLQKLRDNGFVQIAIYRGDFADLPTNSLITVHEAARFLYFVRSDEATNLNMLITR
jgi:hypothetical protein